MDRPIQVALGGMVALIAAATLAVSPTPNQWGAWYVHALLAIGIALIAAAAWLARREYRARPRLVIDDPYTELRGVVHETNPRTGELIGMTSTATSISITSTFSTTHVGYGKDENGYGAYVKVSNQPHVGNRDAEHVHTTLTFFGPDGRQLYQIDGRWSAVVQHPDPERTLVGEERTLAANGSKHPVDIAWQYYHEDAFYAFNEETRFRAKNHDLRFRPLVSPTRVVVVAQGAGCREKAEFLVTCSDGKLTIAARS
ncbi:MAG: hypothetical protein ABSE52_02705 [Candidatus Dormibacteria bacterium]|jgi:hypothetical protein